MLGTTFLILLPQGPARIPPVAMTSASQPAASFAQEATLVAPGTLAGDDGSYGVSAWLDNVAAPRQAARLRLGSEIVFDCGSLAAATIQTLRFHALLYMTGQQGSTANGPPSPADSSEAVAVQQAAVQLLDQVANNWSDVGTGILDPAQYLLGSPWRDTPYADRWSAPNSGAGVHPGPIDRTRTGASAPFVAGHVANGQMRLRIVFEIDIDGGGWDVTHLIDECWIEVDTGSGPVRYAAVSHAAYADATGQQVFLRIGSHGEAAAMATSGDGVFAVDYWEDSLSIQQPPTPPAHQQVWTELQFDVDQAAVPRAELGSLRFMCEVYSHGWHDIDPVSGLPIVPAGPPIGFDDSSEEWAIHDAEIQILNQQTQAWETIAPWFDPGQYTFGNVWRDQPYARGWSRPAPSGPLPYPGPVRLDAGIPFRPELADPQGIVRIRLWKDLQFDTFGNWDVVHAIDYAWLETQPRGVAAYGAACSPQPQRHPQAYAIGVPDVVQGNTAFRFGLTDGPPAFLAALLMNYGRANPPLTDPRYPGCFLYPDVSGSAVVSAPSVGSNGAVLLAYPVPAIPSLQGRRVQAQWFLVDPSLILALSDALELALQ